MDSYYDYNLYKNSKEDTNKKNKKKGRIQSVAKTKVKNTTTHNHKHRHNSTKNAFYPQKNDKNDKNKKNVKNEENINLKPKKGKIDYKKILEEMKNQASLIKIQLLKKDDAINKYKKKYEQQDQIIKDLEFILNDMKSNEKYINLNDVESFKEKKNDFIDDDIDLNEALQEEFAIQAVNQQIIDELCPNPDNMTYEQLLQLEDDLGNVSKGLNAQQFEKLPITKYKKEKYSENFQCIICMEEFNEKEKVKLLPCGHIFHPNCIKEWLMKQKSCPFCKSEVR
jgi:hypothetical protein